jgi:cation:H+ antiporter
VLLDILMLVAGGLVLYLGAEWLVKGAAGLARAFGVQPLVIGLTVVAYGTSAPELVVTLIAAAEGRSAIALGNVIGSNIANIGLILGLTTLIRPPRVESGLIRRELPVLLVATALVPAFLWDDEISRLEGALLTGGAVAFTLFTLRKTRQVAPESTLGVEAREEVELEAAAGGKPKLAALATVGLGALVAGGKLFVDGATGLALDVGMSERLVGLTIVAIGTSLPELAASFVAALRGHSELALGNIVGSNVFNILLVLGGSAVVRPIAESFTANRIDLAALAGVAAIGALVMRGERVITRIEGAVLVAIYAGFIALIGAARI